MVMSNCVKCGAQNRVPAGHLADTGRCGACKAVLPPLQTPVDVADAATFDEIVGKAKVPVLVDFWADWCGPCRMAAPEVKHLAKDLAGRALVLKVDTEANPALAARYQVRSIPNFLVFVNGKVALQKSGVAPRAEMRGWVENAI